MYFFTVVAPSDIGEINEIVNPASPRWKEVGLKLKFTVSDLEIIERNNALGGVVDCFIDLLGRYLKRARPKHEPPTIEALAEALRNVGEERVARDLMDKFASA